MSKTTEKKEIAGTRNLDHAIKSIQDDRTEWTLKEVMAQLNTIIEKNYESEEDDKRIDTDAIYLALAVLQVLDDDGEVTTSEDLEINGLTLLLEE